MANYSAFLSFPFWLLKKQQEIEETEPTSIDKELDQYLESEEQDIDLSIIDPSIISYKPQIANTTVEEFKLEDFENDTEVSLIFGKL